MGQGIEEREKKGAGGKKEKEKEEAGEKEKEKDREIERERGDIVEKGRRQDGDVQLQTGDKVGRRKRDGKIGGDRQGRRIIDRHGQTPPQTTFCLSLRTHRPLNNLAYIPDTTHLVPRQRYPGSRRRPDLEEIKLTRAYTLTDNLRRVATS